MKHLAQYRDSLIMEAHTIQSKIATRKPDPSGFDSPSVLAVGRGRYSPNVVTDDIIYNDYREWIMRVIECDSENQIKDIHVPTPERRDYILDIDKLDQDISRIVEQITHTDGRFTLHNKGTFIELKKQHSHVSCNFQGSVQVKIIQALIPQTQGLDTKQLNLVAGYTKENKYSISTAVRTINKKFSQCFACDLKLIESGRGQHGYTLNPTVRIE